MTCWNDFARTRILHWFRNGVLLIVSSRCIVFYSQESSTGCVVIVEFVYVFLLWNFGFWYLFLNWSSTNQRDIQHVSFPGNVSGMLHFTLVLVRRLLYCTEQDIPFASAAEIIKFDGREKQWHLNCMISELRNPNPIFGIWKLNTASADSQRFIITQLFSAMVKTKEPWWNLRIRYFLQILVAEHERPAKAPKTKLLLVQEVLPQHSQISTIGFYISRLSPTKLDSVCLALFPLVHWLFDQTCWPAYFFGPQPVAFVSFGGEETLTSSSSMFGISNSTARDLSARVTSDGWSVAFQKTFPNFFLAREVHDGCHIIPVLQTISSKLFSN